MENFKSKNNYKCRVCGGIVFLSITLATNYPFCKNCQAELMPNPDLVKDDHSVFLEKSFLNVSGISSTTSVSFLEDIFNI